MRNHSFADNISATIRRVYVEDTCSTLWTQRKSRRNGKIPTNAKDAALSAQNMGSVKSVGALFTEQRSARAKTKRIATRRVQKGCWLVNPTAAVALTTCGSTCSRVREFHCVNSRKKSRELILLSLANVVGLEGEKGRTPSSLQLPALWRLFYSQPMR